MLTYLLTLLSQYKLLQYLPHIMKCQFQKKAGYEHVYSTLSVNRSQHMHVYTRYVSKERISHDGNVIG